MAGETSAAWDAKQRRVGLRDYERVVRAIEAGDPDEARAVMAKSIDAALVAWEKLGPTKLKRPVAWMPPER